MPVIDFVVKLTQQRGGGYGGGGGGRGGYQQQQQQPQNPQIPQKLQRHEMVRTGTGYLNSSMYPLTWVLSCSKDGRVQPLSRKNVIPVSMGT